MATILSIETASEGCSVAIHASGELVCSSALFKSRSSPEMLTVMIQNTLDISSLNFADLSAIAISKGPGSYTGLRIGVSTVKGLCYAKDIPLVSVNTLDTMIAQIKVNAKESICAMLDARRMEVYCKIVALDGKDLLPTSAVIVDDNSFRPILEKGKVIFCGEGAVKCQDIIQHANAQFYDRDIRPDARFMGKKAFINFQKNDFENVAEFEPYYLKEFIGTTPKKSKKVTA